jgi:hypothetical protein
MRTLFALLCCIGFAGVSLAQDTSENQPPKASISAENSQATPESASKPVSESRDNRLFFPTGWIFGYGQFEFAPPHNEPDPGLCAPNAGQPQYGGVNAPCNKFARYLLGGNVVVHPFGRTFLRLVKFEFQPTLAFGKNLPHTLYTWDWNWIGMERQWSAAVDLPKRFDFRVTQHFIWTPQYTDLGPAYIGGNGPWGRNFTIGVRKVFGTYRDYYGAQPWK